mmetsp:Transcript_21689/g.49374  ORF Transcript_21689/g.49374 Transcript_21689/m.49374 type:complete len:330 (+) Transcript_21689:65-1054(+)
MATRTLAALIWLLLLQRADGAVILRRQLAPFQWRAEPSPDKAKATKGVDESQQVPMALIREVLQQDALVQQQMEEVQRTELKVQEQNQHLLDDKNKLQHDRDVLAAHLEALRPGALNKRSRTADTWWFREVIVPMATFFGVLAAILFMFLLMVSVVATPIRLGRNDEDHFLEGCCAKVCRAYFRLHWFTHFMGFCLFFAALLGWVIMWWEGIIQPYLSEFSLIIYVGYIGISLMMLILMELTMICKDNARRLYAKVQRLEEEMKERLKKVRGKVDTILDDIYLSTESESEGMDEEEGRAGGTSEAHYVSESTQRREAREKRKRRQPACL